MQRIATVCDHFGSDLEARSLKLQLEMLHDLMDNELAKEIPDVTKALMKFGPAKRLYSANLCYC